MSRAQEQAQHHRCIDRGQGKYRTKLDHDFERPTRAFKAKEMACQQQMPGRGYRQELGQTLQQAQKGGGKGAVQRIRPFSGSLLIP